MALQQVCRHSTFHLRSRPIPPFPKKPKSRTIPLPFHLSINLHSMHWSLVCHPYYFRLLREAPSAQSQQKLRFLWIFWRQVFSVCLQVFYPKDITELTLLEVPPLSCILKYVFLLNFLWGIQWWNSHPQIRIRLTCRGHPRFNGIEWDAQLKWSGWAQILTHSIETSVTSTGQTDPNSGIGVAPLDSPQKNWVGIHILICKKAGAPPTTLNLRCPLKIEFFKNSNKKFNVWKITSAGSLTKSIVALSVSRTKIGF